MKEEKIEKERDRAAESEVQSRKQLAHHVMNSMKKKMATNYEM